MQERIKFLENAQGTSVQALISRITHHGSHRLEDFDKYEAAHLAEELVSVAKTTGHAKAASYDIFATTLREKIHLSKEQFKAYFLALLADKEFTRIFDASLKLISHLHVLHHIFVLRQEVIKGFPLPIFESPIIGAEPPATSLHNVGSDLRQPAIFLQAVQVKTNLDRCFVKNSACVTFA